MRIAIAGIHNEASAFSAHRADAEYFDPLRGERLLAELALSEALAREVLDDVEFVPVLIAMGGASGLVLPEVFDAILTEVVAGLRSAGDLDGVYLYMHGAVAVVGREAAEERFVGAVREVVGADAVVGLSMDPHGNLSRELVGLIDIAGCHRHSPHIDTRDTPPRVVAQIIHAIRTGVRPLKAWVRVPVLLPGERTSTVVEPGASVFGAVHREIAAAGVDDAGVWVGFAWADEPRNAAAVLVTGTDEAAIAIAAERLATGYWQARESFGIVSQHYGRWDDAIDILLAGAAAPLFISDAGDNVTAGASGDLTYALTETLARRDLFETGKRVLFAGITDPRAVEAAVSCGAGGILDAAIGAAEDARFAGPVEGPWLVTDIIEGQQGEGVVGALLRRDAIDVVVQTTRQRFVTATDATASGLGTLGAALVDVTPYDAVVVKNGYLFPSQVELAGEHFMAITPGGTDLDFDRLHFERRAHPLFPFERDVVADLTPEIIPPWSDETR